MLQLGLSHSPTIHGYLPLGVSLKIMHFRNLAPSFLGRERSYLPVALGYFGIFAYSSTILLSEQRRFTHLLQQRSVQCSILFLLLVSA